MTTPETEPFWSAARRGQLLLQRCAACRSLRFPPAAVCPHCGSEDRDWVPAAGTGTVYSYVVNHRAAPGYTAPYCTAVVQLDEGVRMMTTLVGVEATDDASLLDRAVRVEFDEQGWPRFRPVQP